MSKRQGIFLLGPTSEALSGSKLPSNSQILSTVFYHHQEMHKTIKESAVIVVREAISFWTKARIPTRQEHHLVAKLVCLFEEWRGLLKSRGKNSEFQRAKEEAFKEKLNDLFDMAHQDAMKLIKIQEDRDFLSAQREKGRRGSMICVDRVLTAKEERSKLRREAEARRQQRLEDSRPSTSNTEEAGESTEEDEPEEADVEEDLPIPAPSSVEPHCKRARTNIVTPQLTAALDRAKVSDRNAAIILTEAASIFNCDVRNVNINRSSIRRKRKECRSHLAASIKNEFSVDSQLVVHWDGKLLQDLTGKEHVDRLPVLVTGLGVHKLLGVPKLVGGTGENTAAAVYAALDDWGLTHQVQGMCFDTTSSNTGHRTGACILLEQKFGRDLFHLACRHHTMELVLAAAFTAVMGPTSGPDVLMFKRFQAHWEFIDQSNFQDCMTDELASVRVQPTRDMLLEFFTAQLEIAQPRDDYRELIELAIIFLGQVPPRGVRFRVPGPMHHARWMSKVLYSIKVWLFRAQFKLTAKEEKNIKELCLFCVLVYIKAWLTAPLTNEAPRNDLELMNALLAYKEFNPAISSTTSRKLQNHFWYLSEDLAPLSFFDQQVSTTTKQLMVNAMSQEGTEQPVRPRPDLHTFGQLGLESFLSTNSRAFFQRLEFSTDFLAENPSEWDRRNDYQQMVQKVKSLKCVNDFAERGVALVQSYNKLLTKDEAELQFILQVVDEHRQKYPDTLKRTLTQTHGKAAGGPFIDVKSYSKLHN